MRETIYLQMNSDENRLKYSLVTLTSILENLDDQYDIDLTVITSQKGYESKSAELISLLSTIYKNLVDVKIINFDSYEASLPDEYLIKSTKDIGLYGSIPMWSGAIRYPIYLGELCSSDRVIHIDEDVIIKVSLSELWNYDKDAVFLGARELSPEADYHKRPILTRKILSPDEFNNFDYVNSGVSVHNLSYWRSQKVLEKFIELANSNKLVYLEQDAWNIVFNKVKKFLPINYNWWSRYSSAHFNQDRVERARNIGESINYQECYSDPDQNAKIIHYAGRCKPWIEGKRAPLKSTWDKYKEIYEKATGVDIYAL